MTKLAVVSTVKTVLSELKEYVAHNIAIGVDRVCLFFDEPEDEGAVYFSDKERVEVVRCDASYWHSGLGERPIKHQLRQEFNLNWAAERLCAEGFDWIVSIDCDELLYPKRPLHEILLETSADALHFPILEAVSDKLVYDSIFAPKLFKKEPNWVQGKLAKLFGCRASFFEGEYFRGHSASKMAVRMSNKIERLGIHYPSQTTGELVVERSSDLLLLHYDCVGFDNWYRKWDIRLKAYGTEPNPHNRRARQKQFRLFCEASEHGGQAAIQDLYLRLHTIPNWEQKVLRMLGLLQTVDLQQAKHS